MHDFYRRFVSGGADERHYVFVGRLVTALLMLLAALLTFVLDSARQSFELLMSVGAGTGLLYLLRWYWWRINAWSEIAAMVSSFVAAAAFFIAAKSGHAVASHIALLSTVAITTVVWVVRLRHRAHRPRDARQLLSPGAAGRSRVGTSARRGGRGHHPTDRLSDALLGWVLGCTFVYAALFGSGSLLYRRWPQAAVWIALFVASTIGLVRLLPRMWRGSDD